MSVIVRYQMVYIRIYHILEYIINCIGKCLQILICLVKLLAFFFHLFNALLCYNISFYHFDE